MSSWRGASDIVLISDDEDDLLTIPQVAGPSRWAGRTSGQASNTVPMFIDDSDDETEPSLPPVIVQAMTKAVGGGKRPHAAISRDAPSRVPRSALLNFLDEDSMRVATPPSDVDIPLAVTKISGKKRANGTKHARVEAIPLADADQGSLDVADKEAAATARKWLREAAKEQEKANKIRDREEAKAAKEAAKSLARKEREVNKLRVSKNDTVREIHLYLSPDLQAPSSPIAGALPEIRLRIEGNESALHPLSEADSYLSGLIRFKRHHKARYDSALRRWVPLAHDKWEWEPTVLLVVTADEIIDLVATDELVNWAADARLTLGMRQTDQMLVMIKGLQKYYNKSKAIANREFTAAARAGLGERDPVRRATAVRPEKETVERELVKLQVAQRCFLVHVEKTEDIEDWVFNLAADIAIRPYKLLQKAHLNFCPTDGVKKGSTPLQTFELMLQEVQGITPSAAAGIAAEYGGFRDLMEAYERAEKRGGSKAEEMLQDCEIRTLRNGTANGRRLNKALSKRVYQVFRGQDSLALA